MSQQPISIIGAGLGGITLGRALSKRGIPSIIYEKAPLSPRHGYGITLRASTYRPLLKILDIDEATFKKRVAVDGAVGGEGVFDPKKVVCATHVAPTCFRAHRERLEILIREGLDIRWERGVEKIETEAQSSSSTLCLGDGEKVESTCVVGADGPHSNTRISILPDLELKVLPFVAFNGKKRIDRNTFEELFAPAMDGAATIEHRKNGALLQISLNDKTDDKVSISWVYSRAARGPDDPCYKPNRSKSDATKTPEEFYGEVGALTDLPQPFKEVFDADKLRGERVLSWLMRTADADREQLDRLAAAKGVFLMGDSIHAEAILGGDGANVAVQDGLELARHIEERGRESVVEWYERRAPIWKESLAKSRSVIEEMHAGQKSVL